MCHIPVAKPKQTHYENIIADCPHCSHENILNRVSDLRTVRPIAGANVTCLNPACAKTFRIVGDSINNPHEMLIWESYDLMNQKRYMHCILTLTQAYEVFFNLYFRAELLYKPFGAEAGQDLADFNRLSDMLYNKMKRHAFANMRALFLCHVLTGKSPKNLSEAETIILAIPDRPKVPKDEAIRNAVDGALADCLVQLKHVCIHEVRNRIVHKDAFRPTKQSVESAILEIRNILFPLTYRLQLYDSLN